MAHRDPIARTPESRQFVDDVLGGLASGNYALSAWMRFLARSLARSAAQARLRPNAGVEVTAVHAVMALIGGWRWASVAWLLCITHLGLLGDRATFGWPNRLTVLRALLPTLAPCSRWISVVALSTDFADGLIARNGSETAFGAFADPIADGVFWSWYALRWERSRWFRWVPLTIFATTVAGISAAYFVRARSIDYPRPIAIRNASGVAQLALALRILLGAVQ